MNGLQDKNVLVTGGTSGIGQAIALQFAKEGANVAINYRHDPDSADETVAKIDAVMEECERQMADCGVDYIRVQGDVTVESDVVEMVADSIEKLEGMDIVINNAGIQRSTPSHEISSQEFDKVLDTNLRGAFLVAREAIQHFLEQGKPGVIINVSSVHQQIPKPRYLSYSVSKGGMQNLTRTLALEYAGRGIRVNAIGPGATITAINRAWVDDPEKKAEVERHIPMGRAASAEEMAVVTCFLASQDAAYITGQTLFVDGGLTLYPDFRTAWSSE